MKSRLKKRTAKKSSAKRSVKAAAHGASPSVETVLVMRTCRADMTSKNGFKWPTSGLAEAPDWSPRQECGSGLHGLLWGVGDASLLSWEDDAKWLVVEVAADSIVDLEGKVKFPRGEVIFVGDRIEAAKLIGQRAPNGSAIVSGTATAGDRGTATAGYRGTATAGDGGTATARDCGTATAGYSGTATAGDRGTATAGYGGTATAGYGGTATAGYRGTATARDRGTATAGYGGTATAGYGGTATAGVSGTATVGAFGTATVGARGTATAGVSGTATAGGGGTATAGGGGTARSGDMGTIVVHWYDYRERISVGYVGEDGVKPNTFYRCDEAGKLVEVVS